MRVREKLSPEDETLLQVQAEKLVVSYNGDVWEALKAIMVHVGDIERTVREVDRVYPGIFVITEEAA
jgi:hypothetical protein